MSEQAAYRLQIDWDRDGFFCDGVTASDPLNLVTAPVTFHGLFYFGASANSAVSLSWEATAWGLRVWTVVTGGDADGGIAIGQNEDAPAMTVIPVLPSTEYTVQIAVQLVSAAGSADLRLTVVNPANDAVITSFNFTPTTAWATYTRTFTSGASQTAARIDVRKRTDSAATTFKATGPLLVAGASAPSAFNAGHISNPYDDLWAFCDAVTFRYGIDQYTEAVAPASSLTAVLNNIDHVFAPENPPLERSTGVLQNTGAPVIATEALLGTSLAGDDGMWLRPGFFSRGMLARLQADYAGETHTLYLGTLDSLRADAGTHGGRRATITVIDPVPQLERAQYDADLQLNVRTDAVLTQLFERGELLYPYPAQTWLLGVPGASELGVTTWLFENRLTDFDAGDTTLEFAGDTTGTGVLTSAVQLIRDVVYAELGGRFFWDARAGQFRFFRRTRDIRTLAAASAPGVLELDAPPEYAWGDDLINKVAVTYYPRVIGAAASVLYTLGSVPMSLAAGQARTMSVRFQVVDAPNATVAGQDMILPVPGLDYTTTANADGTGASQNASLTVNANFHALGAELTFVNTGGAPLYVQTFQLRGTPLVSYRAVQASAVASDSLVAQGEYRRTIDLPALGDAALAESYATYLVQRYKQPIGRISAASVWANRDAATMARVLGMAVGDHVRLHDPFLNNQAAKVLVTGMTHTILPNGSHQLRLNAEPLDRYLYWILGDATLSVLGSTTRLSI